jgi:hypothetical protein
VNHRLGRLLPVAALLAAGAPLMATTAATADPPDCTTRTTGAQTAELDIDGDGTVDGAVGVPRYPSQTRPSLPEAGSVHVQYGSGFTWIVTPARVGLGGPTPGGHFGAAVALGDLSGDGCADLAIGEPGTGSAYLVDGSPDKTFSGANGEVLQGGQVGDLFGAAIVETDRNAGSTPVAARDLWVGAPGTDMDGVADAGAIYHYAVLPGGHPQLLETLTASSPVVGGELQAGGRFGEILAPTWNGVYVGRPHEDVTGHPDAGAFTSLRIDPNTGALSAAQTFTQATHDIQGAPEAGDRFGASVSGPGTVVVAVGAPGEDSGGKADTGFVQSFRADEATGELQGSLYYTQTNHLVPGKAEAGDRFGAAVLVSPGSILCGTESEESGLSLLVGSPGEDIGSRPSRRDAGTVTVLDLDRTNPYKFGPCRIAPLRQGHGLPGQPERGDHAGQALGAIRGGEQNADDYGVTALVGVPGEDLAGSGIRDGGIVAMVRPSAGSRSAIHLRASTVRFFATESRGLEFGSVFAQYQVGFV